MARKQIELSDLLEFRDPRNIPAYSVGEAAHYLTIPVATLRSWVMGTSYRVAQGKKRFVRVIDLPKSDVPLLSFFNLAEAHVLRALRTKHNVPLPSIRRALKYVSEKKGWKRPLLQQEFKTDGVSLFVNHLGKLVDASAGGQSVFREMIEAHLSRLEWEDNEVARLYPFTRLNSFEAPRSVFIDPRFSFGRPILKESRIATAVIAERYKAGDSIEDLAKDYECSRLEIEEGVRCELRVQAAA